MNILKIIYRTIMCVLMMINISMFIFNYTNLNIVKEKVDEMRVMQRTRHVETVWINDVPYEIAFDFEETE